MSAIKLKVLGVGAPIIDSIVPVQDDFLEKIHGEKGGMELTSREVIDEILAQTETPATNVVAGSAGNTTYALARTGIPCAFLGMIGNDANGECFRSQYEAMDIDTSRLRVHPTEATANCLVLVTPDSERTMRTVLGASACLNPEEVTAKDFEGVTHVHIEGYLLYNEPMLRRVLELAYDADCTLSLNLASFEVVRNCKPLIKEILENNINVVTANDLEAKAFADGETSIEDGIDALAELCPTVCVTLGTDGAIIRSFEEEIKIDAVKVDKVVDTTAAGDLWNAGFLYGYLQNHPLEACGKYASLVAAEAVKVMGTGASISDEAWENLMDNMA